jgi:two-component system, OmpR family, copper resistance phosphate regulon response regulator CusR
MKILIVEDERKIAESLKKGLEAQHYRVDLAFDGPSGLDMALSGSYLLLILDRMLPGLDGIQVIQKLREQGCQTPVLMLTALTRIHERVEGFQAGADDYLAKPFALAELSARVEAILRRSTLRTAQDIRQFGDLSVCYSAQTVTRSGKSIELSPKEFRCLCILCETPGQLVSRRDLLHKVWDLNFETETNIVEVTVRRLRQKLDDPFAVKLIRTVRGAGYLLEVTEQ